MPDAQCTRSRAWRVVNTRVSHHESTGIIRHSRTRMVLTAYLALSPVTGYRMHTSFLLRWSLKTDSMAAPIGLRRWRWRWSLDWDDLAIVAWKKGGSVA